MSCIGYLASYAFYSQFNGQMEKVNKILYIEALNVFNS